MIREGQAREGRGAGRAEDVAEDVTEDVLGAAKDGSMKVFIVARVIFQRRNPRPTHARHPPRLPFGDT